MKNKKKLILGIVIILGLLFISKKPENAPEGKRLSSGDFNMWFHLDEIDNYSNVKKYLENDTYYFLDHIDFVETDQYPQGICITEEYLLISSYSDAQGVLGKLKIFDKISGEYLLTLEMDEDSHVGGITFDGEYIWICNSSKMSLERISYSFVKELIESHKGKNIDVRNLVQVYRVNNIPSSVTYHEGALWVVSHSILENSIMCGYRFDKVKKKLQPFVTLDIPAQVQGLAFSEQGELYLSTSYGRRETSYIKKYRSIFAMIHDVNDYEDQLLPPCAEGIVCEDELLYVLFESAGTKYLDGTDGKGKSISPLDKILVIHK